jgi:hypothetical protein
MKRRTTALISSFGTIAAIAFAGCLFMIGVANVIEGIGCCWQSEREGSC